MAACCRAAAALEGAEDAHRRAETENEQLRARVAELEADRERRERDWVVFRAERAAGVDSLRRAEARVAELVQKVETREATISLLNKGAVELGKRISQLETELASLRARISGELVITVYGETVVQIKERIAAALRS